MTQKIVKVSLKVGSGAARFRVGVQAQSIRKALSMVGGRYPKGEARVVLPIEPEGFFVRDAAAAGGCSDPSRSTKSRPEGLGEEAIG